MFVCLPSMAVDSLPGERRTRKRHAVSVLRNAAPRAGAHAADGQRRPFAAGSAVQPGSAYTVRPCHGGLARQLRACDPAVGKPEFGLSDTRIDGETVPVTEEIATATAWCDLKRFRRLTGRSNDPKLLLVAPMSGHHATLLRGTVQAFLPDHDVYITDWHNARDIPVGVPDFDLDDYIDHVIGFLRRLGAGTHVVAVC